MSDPPGEENQNADVDAEEDPGQEAADVDAEEDLPDPFATLERYLIEGPTCRIACRIISSMILFNDGIDFLE